MTPDLFRAVLDEEMAALRATLGEAAFDAGRFADAVRIFTDMSLAEEFEEFLTLPAYRLL